MEHGKLRDLHRLIIFGMPSPPRSLWTYKDPGGLVGPNEREESVLEEMQVECQESNRQSPEKI